MSKIKVKTKKTKKWKPLVQFVSIEKLEEYILNNTNSNGIFLDNNRKYYMEICQSENNLSKFTIYDYNNLPSDIKDIITNNSLFIDCYPECSEYEMRKDKFFKLFDDIIKSGRLFYSID